VCVSYPAQRAAEESGVEPHRLKIERDIAVANSSYISYLQLGRPENVLVVLEEMLP